MKLITGREGKAHVTSTQFRNIIQSIAGTGSYIADLGEQLAPELTSNNLIRIRSGMLFHHGSVSEVPDGTYDEVTIANGTQSMKRIDLIVSRYTKNSDTDVEKSEWVVIQGTPAASNPTVPAHTAGNMQDGDLVDDCPVYEVELDGISVVDIRVLPPAIKCMDKALKEVNSSIDGLSDQDMVDALLEQGYIDMYFMCNGCGTTAYLRSSTFYVPKYVTDRVTISGTPTSIYVIDSASDYTNGGTSVDRAYKYVAQKNNNFFLYSSEIGATGNNNLSWKTVRVRCTVTAK